MMTPAQRIQCIEALLKTAFTPSYLEVKDDSQKHAAHFANHQGAGHFSIKIAATPLADKSRIEAHRMVYQTLAELIPTEIHALQIKILA